LAYSEARVKKPHAGRRSLKLEVVGEFWQLSKAQRSECIQKVSYLGSISVIVLIVVQAAPMAEPVNISELDPDPHDIPNLKDSRVIGNRGIVVRTHFEPNDEKAWSIFLAALEELERKSLANMFDNPMESDSESEEEAAEGEDQVDKTSPAGDNADAEMAETELLSAPPPLTYESDAIFVVIDPTKQESHQALKERLSGASNIALLRLFNDASVTPAPDLPPNAPKRIKPGHRLIDEHGYQVCPRFYTIVKLTSSYQEVYMGARIWVWDQQSAKDQTLRLISPQVFVYGDAT
jgi:hypothetical protein